jgi:hypothetical protein
VDLPVCDIAFKIPDRNSGDQDVFQDVKLKGLARIMHFSVILRGLNVAIVP